ncbi:AP-4 complex subunit sigma-1, variant 2 [Basidiobolus ranarum]|uniref:AP complex subunit sigma n=1 Tax=Basidiobolus ranarum TaxID=34480 RepID=A0ABR2W478_9FUNG
MIHFILIINKQGRTRFSKYFTEIGVSPLQRSIFEAELARKIIPRPESQCSIIFHEQYKFVYRRYASLFFILGISPEDNEFEVIEFVQNWVEILNVYFDKVRELDISFLSF